MVALSNALATLHNITKLDMSDNIYGIEGATAMANALQGKHHLVHNMKWGAELNGNGGYSSAELRWIWGGDFWWS